MLSTKGVEPPSSSLIPDKKGQVAALQSSIWNLLSTSDEYLDCEIMIPKVSTYFETNELS